MIINADLHIHSKYSMATSKNMIIPTIAVESQKKGLDLVATGDAFHSEWLEHLENTLIQNKSKGIYHTNESVEDNSTNYITTVEVEDNQRIHHLILIPSIDVAWSMRDEFATKNMDADGRPKIRMDASQIIEIARDYNCLIGPTHIFTPWTGIFKEYDSIIDCYRIKPDFVELGLSADSTMANKIGQLQEYTFLTNSDSHSPWPHRIGREFNRISIKELSYQGLKDAIKNNQIVENYGFDPRMGKYYETGCIKCKKIYDMEKAKSLNMKCECGGRIKKGVKSRVDELNSNDDITIMRPHYQYILPLAELISTIYDKGVTTKFVQTRYDNLIEVFGNEINVLIDVDINKIRGEDKLLADIIKQYRDDKLKVTVGRAGQYGYVEY